MPLSICPQGKGSSRDDQARPLIYGAILIASILFLPNGLESLVPMLKGRFAGKAPGGPGSEGEKAAAE